MTDWGCVQLQQELQAAIQILREALTAEVGPTGDPATACHSSRAVGPLVAAQAPSAQSSPRPILAEEKLPKVQAVGRKRPAAELSAEPGSLQGRERAGDTSFRQLDHSSAAQGQAPDFRLLAQQYSALQPFLTFTAGQEAKFDFSLPEASRFAVHLCCSRQLQASCVCAFCLARF